MMIRLDMLSLSLLVIVCCCICCTFSHATFNASHVRLVDYDSTTGNFLFRSSIPRTETNEFAYTELAATFRQLAAMAKLQFPAEYYLVDLCFLTTEMDSIAMESTYFKENPELGEFHNWPIWGIGLPNVTVGCKMLGLQNCSSEQPDALSEEVKEVLANKYDLWANGDQLSSRISTVHQWLHTKSQNKTLVLMGHCDCGCDRTGEFFAAYYMQYQNLTFTEAMKYDVTVPERNITYVNQVATEWYCEYMYYTGQYHHDVNDCGNCVPFACNGGTKLQ